MLFSFTFNDIPTPTHELRLIIFKHNIYNTLLSTEYSYKNSLFYILLTNMFLHDEYNTSQNIV